MVESGTRQADAASELTRKNDASSLSSVLLFPLLSFLPLPPPPLLPAMLAKLAAALLLLVAGAAAQGEDKT